MKTPVSDPVCQYRELRPEIDRAVLECLAGGEYILGEQVRGFEKEFADFLGVRYAVGLASGTDALILSLKALGVGPGDEVITTPFTYFATVQSILAVGARPVFCDIEPKTLGMDPARLPECLTPRVKAILPVHLFGRMCRIGEIADFAGRRGLKVVEDACQAAGAGVGGVMAGAFGDCGCFSFFPTKNLSCAGDGGMAVTGCPETALRMRALAAQGSGEAGRAIWRLDTGGNFFPPPGAPEKYIHYLCGTNSRLDALQAAILRQKLPHLDRWNRERRRLAQRYRKGLTGLDLTLPEGAPFPEAVYHQYTLRCPEREILCAALRRRGIGFGIYYPLPLHLQPALRHLGYCRGDFPQAEAACRQVLSLPLYPGLTEKAQDEVIQTIQMVLR